MAPARALLIVCVTLLVAAPAALAQRPRPPAPVIELSGTIDPATSGWVRGALDDAQDDHAPFAVLRIDTPGGLDSSMRQIVRAIIAARMPVIAWVAPDGARAASAGLFVTQAADVAAMAPQTNIGSATPITLGGGGEDEVLGRKIRNDAAAYVRALAEAHGRNAALAERMVRDAVNVTASQALRARLIDLVAGDRRALLAALDGRHLRGPKAQTLDTAGVRLQTRDMPWTVQVKQFLVDPTVAYLLMLAGLIGLLVEALTPGAIGPGVFGAISLLLGLYGTAQLPVTAGGIALLALGLGFLAAEVKVTSGLLGVAGVAALVAGGLLLFDTGDQALAVSVPAAVAAGAALGSLVVFAASKSASARRAPVRGGPGELVGHPASVRVALDPAGQVYVQGALWRARSETGEPIAAGETVTVTAVDGLTLTVRPQQKEPAT
jgi:membrane-bound serine protease (ClpP class)